MMRVEKPWGHEEIWAQTDKYVGKHLHINPGHRLSRQYHAKKEETIRVASGILHLEIGQGESVTVKRLLPGEVFHISPGTVHRFCAAEEKVILVEVSTPVLDDVVRLQDDYER
jgi:mannose-6-phosphate isomerase-like protein (cupin superfamily)